MRLLLASASPRRAQLLRDAGYDFDVAPADIDEQRFDGEMPADYVARLAQAKAEAVVPRFSGRIIIGADTVVVIDGFVLGKPRDRADAIGMLGRLAGRRHEVLTGVTVTDGARSIHGVEITKVTFAPLDLPAIDSYVKTGESSDKAGAYAIQGVGSRFVERIDGSYTNVIGLPIPLVHRIIAEFDSKVQEA